MLDANGHLWIVQKSFFEMGNDGRCRLIEREPGQLDVARQRQCDGAVAVDIIQAGQILFTKNDDAHLIARLHDIGLGK